MLQTKWYGKKKRFDQLQDIVQASCLTFNFLCQVRGRWPVEDFHANEVPVEFDDVIEEIFE